MLAAGIIDPAKVSRNALQNAQRGRPVLTTDLMVTVYDEKAEETIRRNLLKKNTPGADIF
jgi:chaperonin GroEL (HSP60 family)